MTSFFADVNRGFHNWALTELFGHHANGQYVPNPGDLVYDVLGKVVYEVASVDYQTGVSSLVLWERVRLNQELDYVDYFLTDGTSDTDDSSRIYIDYSLDRPVMRFDARLIVPSTEAVAVRVYKGGDITSNTAQVVSMYLDPSSPFPQQDVPLLVADVPQQNLPTLKTPAICYCTAELFNGDIVTAVVLNASGKKLSTTRMVVHRTELVRRTNSLNRYVTGIAIDSPALQAENPNIIEIPVNATIDSISMMGVVSYSDGSTVTVPLTGKFNLVGIDGYYSTVLGQAVPLVLEYRLSNAERAINSNVTAQRILTRTYTLLSVKGNGVTDGSSTAYGVKLFGYPKWIQGLLEYSMEYWVHIKDIGLIYATPYVRDAINATSVFDGGNLGIYQRFMVTLNLNDVSSAYAQYRHYQAMDVSLVRAGYVKESPLWTVAYQDSDGRYASEGHAVRGSVIQTTPTKRWNMSFVQGGQSLDAWLQNTYYNAKPIYNPGLSLAPKRPTHVIFSRFSGADPVEVNLNSMQWYMPYQVNGDFVNGDVIMMRFIYREIGKPDEDLAMGGAPFIDIT